MYSYTVRKICSLAAGLMLVLFVIRSKILFKSYYFVFIAPKFLPKVVLASYYDLAFIAGVSAVTILLTYLLRYRPRFLQ